MNVKIGYAIILLFHNFHFGGQTKDTYIKIYYKIPNYIKMCYKTPFSNILYFDIYFKERIQILCEQYIHIIHI